MLGKIGLTELAVILVIALIIFGPRKLPEIGRAIGKGIREFKQATEEIGRSVSLDDDGEARKSNPVKENTGVEKNTVEMAVTSADMGKE